MEDLVKKIQDSYAQFNANAVAQMEAGNKAAGARARKVSLELEKLLREFRKISVKETRK